MANLFCPRIPKGVRKLISELYIKERISQEIRKRLRILSSSSKAVKLILPKIPKRLICFNKLPQEFFTVRQFSKDFFRCVSLSENEFLTEGTDILCPP